MEQAEPSARRAWIVGAVGAALVALIVAVGLLWPTPDPPFRRSGAPLTVSAWVPYWEVESGLASFEANAALFADVSLMAFSAQGAGTVVPYPNLPSGALDALRAKAAATGAAGLITIFDDMPAGGMAAVLADPAARAQHVATIVGLVDGGGYDGVDLDYETFAFTDPRSTWEATRPAWVAFLRELAGELDERGKLLVVSVPPVYEDGGPTDRGAWVYDYAAMGGIVDRIRVMAYDYSTSRPGPIAPLEWVDDLTDAIVELVPPAKLDLGIPMYGRSWVVSIDGICPVDQEPSTSALSTADAAARAAARGVVPVWDEETAEARFDYTDVLTGADATGQATACTVERTVRYLDHRAIQARAQLAWRADLHGVALWALGYDDAATWAGLADAREGLRPGETLAAR